MLSASSKYALSALLCLAREQESGDGFMRVEELSVKANVPAPYLSKIIKALAQKQVVETRRGLTGGVRLGANRNKISFYDICVALDDPVVKEQCLLSKRSCGVGATCPMHEEWGKSRARIHSFLKKSKIARTMSRQRRK